jgi:pimeloyl-ACP methyl ester carboxylesterase
MVGELDDDTVMAVADVLVTQVPGARKNIMSGTAHLPNMEKPKEFNQMVLEFLKLVSPYKQ